MQEIIFKVQGSAEDPYKVRFVKRTNRNISAYCSCPAGQNGQYCKHRFNILDGRIKNIVSNNLEEIKVVQSWLPGTDLETAIIKMKKLEAEVEQIKRHLLAAKKEVAKAMRD